MKQTMNTIAILAIIMISLAVAGPTSAQTTWDYSGNNIYNLNSGTVGIGTGSSGFGANIKLHVRDSIFPSLRIDSGSEFNLRLDLAVATANGFYSPFATTGDSVLRAVTGDLILNSLGTEGAIRFGLGGYPNTKEYMALLHDNQESRRFVLYDDDHNEIMSVLEDGTVRVKVLDIIGIAGSDLAEPFEVRDSRFADPGTVLSIDPESPGRLRISCRAHDRTVAGVVSGAGGLHPGIVLGGVNEESQGDPSVALSGRVWVKAVSSNGPINPGDLLTTSDVEGHAMKVIEPTRSQGAILGKAMSSLEEESGFVLALVSLQ